MSVEIYRYFWIINYISCVNIRINRDMNDNCLPKTKCDEKVGALPDLITLEEKNDKSVALKGKVICYFNM